MSRKAKRKRPRPPRRVIIDHAATGSRKTTTGSRYRDKVTRAGRTMRDTRMPSVEALRDRQAKP